MKIVCWCNDEVIEKLTEVVGIKPKTSERLPAGASPHGTHQVVYEIEEQKDANDAWHNILISPSLKGKVKTRLMA